MAGKTDFAEDLLIDYVTGRRTDIGFNAGGYLALSNALPSDDAGTGFTEPNDGGYARIRLTSSNMNAASGGSADNSADITFGPAADTDWGTIFAVGIYDRDGTGGAGNLIWWNQLQNSITVDLGESFEFQTGDLTIQED